MTKRKHWIEGRWNGLVNYECAYCPFAAAEKADGTAALSQIKRHVGEHLAGARLPPTEPVAPLLSDEGEFAIDFASEEAVQDAAKLTLEGLEHLKSQKPSGKGGYTVANVRAAAAATTREEG